MADLQITTRLSYRYDKSQLPEVTKHSRFYQFDLTAELYINKRIVLFTYD